MRSIEAAHCCASVAAEMVTPSAWPITWHGNANFAVIAAASSDSNVVR